MNLEDQSPIMSRCFQYDLEHLRDTEADYYEVAMKSDPREWSDLLDAEVKWRHKFKSQGMNFIISIHGDPGTGKSSIGHALSKKVTGVYKVPFKLSKHLFYSVPELNLALDSARPGETYWQDEQPRGFTGIMSAADARLLLEKEDQLRRNQNNLIFCAPFEAVHSHQFVFKTLPFIERQKDGYPEYFTCVLYTKRHFDDLEVARGVLTFPMMSKKEFKEYDAAHKRHINRLQKGQYTSLLSLEADAKRVVKESGDSLILENKKGEKLLASKALIDLKIYETIGTKKYTVAGSEMLREKVKELLRKKIGGSP